MSRGASSRGGNGVAVGVGAVGGWAVGGTVGVVVGTAGLRVGAGGCGVGDGGTGDGTGLSVATGTGLSVATGTVTVGVVVGVENAARDSVAVGVVGIDA